MRKAVQVFGPVRVVQRIQTGLCQQPGHVRCKRLSGRRAAQIELRIGDGCNFVTGPQPGRTLPNANIQIRTADAVEDSRRRFLETVCCVMSVREGRSASSVRWRADWVEPDNVYFSFGVMLPIICASICVSRGGQRHQADQTFASEFLPVCASCPALQWRPP